MIAVGAAQSIERQWSPSAVHDTVAAALRDPAFQRSVGRSLADRFLIWFFDALHRLGRLFTHLPSTRTLGLALIALLVLFVAVRIIITARERDDGAKRTSRRRGAMAARDPWESADAFGAEGAYEDAAHALYRGVILALGRDERVRVDPSKTSGDYARELRRRGSPSLAPFRAFTRRFDVAVYGHEGVDENVLAELRELSAPFRLRRRAA